MKTRHPLFDTWDQMIQQQLPNFLRLYLNPHVVETCLCLSRYVRETWYESVSPRPHFQSFLANSFDEALSGAIKLAALQCRLHGNVQDRSDSRPGGRRRSVCLGADRRSSPARVHSGYLRVRQK